MQALHEGDDADGFPREVFQTAARGARPLSPVALLTLVIVGALRGVTTLRGMERFARLDLRGIWILGGWCPDHSTLGRFIEGLHGEVSEALFERLTVEALRAIGKRVCDVSLDGTIVCAVASRYGRLHADAITERLARAQQRAAAASGDEKATEALERARACADALAAQQRVRREVGRDLESIQICPSEPEAVTHKTKEGAFHPAYVGSVVATPERFIVGVDVDPRDELVSVQPMLEQAMAISARVDVALSSTANVRAGEATGSPREAAPDAGGTAPPSTASEPDSKAPARAAHTIAIARADGAYLVSKVLDLERKLGIELRINIGSLAESVVQPQGFNPAAPYAFDKDRFRLVVLPATEYAPERICLQCPMGALLEHERNYPANGRVPAATSYRAHGVRCASCAYAGRCLQKAKQRTVRRYRSDALREAMRDRMLSPDALAERGVRSQSVEPCFGSMKGPQRLRRFHRRGLRGARLEFVLHALAHNMGRLASIARGGRRSGPAGRPHGGSPDGVRGSSRRVGATTPEASPTATMRARRGSRRTGRGPARFPRQHWHETPCAWSTSHARALNVTHSATASGGACTRRLFDEQVCCRGA